jgi:hypothetical protein
VRRLRHPHALLARFLEGFLETLALIAPRRGDPGDRPARRVEVFIYRLLVVCALIGLANSNPTLRQMFDAIL